MVCLPFGFVSVAGGFLCGWVAVPGVPLSIVLCSASRVGLVRFLWFIVCPRCVPLYFAVVFSLVVIVVFFWVLRFFMLLGFEFLASIVFPVLGVSFVGFGVCCLFWRSGLRVLFPFRFVGLMGCAWVVAFWRLVLSPLSGACRLWYWLWVWGGSVSWGAGSTFWGLSGWLVFSVLFLVFLFGWVWNGYVFLVLGAFRYYVSGEACLRLRVSGGRVISLQLCRLFPGFEPGVLRYFCIVACGVLSVVRCGVWGCGYYRCPFCTLCVV